MIAERWPPGQDQPTSERFVGWALPTASVWWAMPTLHPSVAKPMNSESGQTGESDQCLDQALDQDADGGPHQPAVERAPAAEGDGAVGGAGNIEPTPRWRACRPGFFLPVRVLSRVFRGKFLAGLRSLGDAGQLRWPGGRAALPDAGWYASLLAKDWVVYAKPPFGGPAQVLKYLARYTHRVAISNSRLLDLQGGRVTFRYKDYADAHRQKTMTLSADEFLRRFVQHVLPGGFVKVRHYGLLANRHRQERLALCRRLLLVVNLPDAPATPLEPAQLRCCPQCGGTRLVYHALTPADPADPAIRQDSS